MKEKTETTVCHSVIGRALKVTKANPYIPNQRLANYPASPLGPMTKQFSGCCTKPYQLFPSSVDVGIKIVLILLTSVFAQSLGFKLASLVLMQCIVRASYGHNETVMNGPSLPIPEHVPPELVHAKKQSAQGSGEGGEGK